MTDRRVDINELFNSSRITPAISVIVILCAIAMMLDGIDFQLFAFAIQSIATEWGREVSTFGLAFAATGLGTLVGALLLGSLADKIGRRKAIIVSVAIVAMSSLATPLVPSFEVLIFTRVCFGIGFGGALPNLVALTAEYSPLRLRSTMVAVMLTGLPLGVAGSGLVAAWIMPQAGWRGMFYLSGSLTVLITAALIVGLPESARFMVAIGAPQRAIKDLVTKVTGHVFGESDVLVLSEKKTAGSSILSLFRERRAVMTVLIWLGAASIYLVIYLFFSWLPVLARKLGASDSIAIAATSLFAVGGIFGGLFIGWLADRIGFFAAIPGALLLATISLLVLAAGDSGVSVLLVCISLVGAGTLGAQTALSTLAAELYPTAIRATGVGSTYGMGRVGAIAGPILGGVFVGRNLGGQTIFLLAAVALALAAVEILLIAYFRQVPAAVLVPAGE